MPVKQLLGRPTTTATNHTFAYASSAHSLYTISHNYKQRQTTCTNSAPADCCCSRNRRASVCCAAKERQQEGSSWAHFDTYSSCTVHSICSHYMLWDLATLAWEHPRSPHHSIPQLLVIRRRNEPTHHFCAHSLSLVLHSLSLVQTLHGCDRAVHMSSTGLRQPMHAYAQTQ